jgi:microcin C transport system substrate-binding protein
MFARVCLILLTLFSLNSQAQTITIKRAALLPSLANRNTPSALTILIMPIPCPERGTIVNATIGTFDNFNRYALRGNPGVRTDALYDTLFTTSDDEPGSYYPLIAAHTRYADDFSWMEITLNPHARFMMAARLPPAMSPSRSTNL